MPGDPDVAAANGAVDGPEIVGDDAAAADAGGADVDGKEGAAEDGKAVEEEPQGNRAEEQLGALAAKIKGKRALAGCPDLAGDETHPIFTAYCAADNEQCKRL